MRLLLAVLATTLVVTLTNANLTPTIVFRAHLDILVKQGNSLKTCLNKVVHPLGETSQFAADVAKINGLMTHLEQRISTMIDVITGVMAIPFVGQAASVVLLPARTVLSTVDNGIKTVSRAISKVVGVIRGWLAPLAVIQKDVAQVNSVIGKIVKVIGSAEDETTKMITCLATLPNSKSKTQLEGAVNGVTKTMDHVPMSLIHPVQTVTGGCHKVEGIMGKLHLVRKRKRSLPSLHKVVDVLQKIDSGMGPVGKFLDKVHDALNKKICLIKDLIKIGKVIVKKVGEWGKQLVHGVEHVGKEIVHGVEHAGKEIVHGVEHTGKELEHVGQEIGHGVESAVHSVGHSVESAVHSIGHTLHHIFGRQVHDVVQSDVDGQYYVILDAGADTSSHVARRSLDICVSIHDALKVVSGVTNGILSEAQKFIGKLFHGHSPFHLPGLSPDFFNLGKLLSHFNIPMPNMSNLLKLGGNVVTQALKFSPLAAYTKAAPVCKAALTG